MGSAESRLQRHQTAGTDLWPAHKKTKHKNKFIAFLLPVSVHHLNSKSMRCSLTRRESGTVGHSCFHFRLIPATPNAINSTPRNKNVCMETKSRFTTWMWTTSVDPLKKKKTVAVRINGKNTLCIQCSLSCSWRATWNSAKSWNQQLPWIACLVLLYTARLWLFKLAGALALKFKVWD